MVVSGEVVRGKGGGGEELNNWSYFYSLLSTLRLKTLRAGAGRLLPALVFWTYIEQKLTIRKEVFLKRAPLIKRNEKLEGSLVATRMSIVRYVVVLHLHTHHSPLGALRPSADVGNKRDSDRSLRSCCSDRKKTKCYSKWASVNPRVRKEVRD